VIRPFVYQALPMRVVFADIPHLAELAVAHPYANPRPVTRDGIQALLWTAWTGAPPPRSAPTVQTRPTT
jgi:maleylacetate reductase